MSSTTFVFITDRNDLDDQAYKTLRQGIGDPVKKADSRNDLMRLVKEGNARVIVTTIQKFDDEGDIKREPQCHCYFRRGASVAKQGAGAKNEKYAPERFVFRDYGNAH